MNIPDEAVEAAAQALVPTFEALRPVIGATIDLRHIARTALEAAAPVLFAPALGLAGEMDNTHGSIRGHVTTHQLRKAIGVGL